MPGYEIARRTGVSPASVSRILRRARLSRWRDLNPPPPISRSDTGTTS
jgi:DNA-binding MurR/RpiR family transcriptional regulator